MRTIYFVDTACFDVREATPNLPYPDSLTYHHHSFSTDAKNALWEVEKSLANPKTISVRIEIQRENGGEQIG